MQPLCSHDTQPFSARRYEQRGDSRCRGWPVCSSDKAELASSWLDRQLALIKHIRLVSAWRHRESGSTLLLYRWLNLEPHFDSWCRDSWLTCSRPAHLLLSLLLFFYSLTFFVSSLMEWRVKGHRGHSGLDCKDEFASHGTWLILRFTLWQKNPLSLNIDIQYWYNCIPASPLHPPPRPPSFHGRAGLV